jgi:hypothetical protein
MFHSYRRKILGGVIAAACAGATLTVPAAGAASAAPVAAAADATVCPAGIDANSFASADQLKRTMTKITDFGMLRLPGSGSHNEMLRWLENTLFDMPDVQLSRQTYRMDAWQPTTKTKGKAGRDIAKAGTLTAIRSGHKDKKIRVAGAIAFSKATGSKGKLGKLVYLPSGVPITAANSRGKVVIRDVPKTKVPYNTLSALSYYQTPDSAADAGADYSRPYLSIESTADSEAAASAGAVGIIRAFNLPTGQVRGYVSSHNGTLQKIPGVWVGATERDTLKRLAVRGAKVRIGVAAEVKKNVPTRNVIARIPGQSDDKIVLVTNSDGNNWVQENGPAAFLGLADYFSKLPLECRPKTIEFVFTSAHLGYAWDGADLYAQRIADSPNRSKVGTVIVAEHLGTRELVPVATPGPGDRLKFTGKAEPYAWFAPVESPALSSTLVNAVKGRNQERTSVLRGLDAPDTKRAPVFCGFGGLANWFHSRLIPTIGGISGPETLWTPYQGASAVDFNRLRSQSLVVGDTVVALSKLTNAQLAGGYPQSRAALEAGARTACSVARPAKVAP